MTSTSVRGELDRLTAQGRAARARLSDPMAERRKRVAAGLGVEEKMAALRKHLVPVDGHVLWGGPERFGHMVVVIDGVDFSARRMLYELAYGRAGRRKVRRLCDEPLCVSPLHAEAS